MNCLVVSQGGRSFDIVGWNLAKYLGCHFQSWDYRIHKDIDILIVVGNIAPKITMITASYRSAKKIIWYVAQEGLPIYYTGIDMARRLKPYIIVPSRFVKRLVEQSGLWVDAVIPHALRLKPLSLRKIDVSKRKHRYMYIGFYDVRKFPPWSKKLFELLGYDITVLTTRNNQLITKYNKVIWIDNPLPDSVLVRIYREHRMYLNLSTLEGFGLPILEAMSQGVVPVVPDTEPFTEICNIESCYFYRLDNEVMTVHYNYQIMNMPKYDPYEVYHLLTYLDIDNVMSEYAVRRSLDFLPEKVYGRFREFIC